METSLYIVIAVAVVVLLLFLIFTSYKKPKVRAILPLQYVALLEANVPFYKTLDDGKKKEFCNRVQAFLSEVKITGVKTEVEDLDRVLVAASAIIPIFGFPEWEYINVNEVLIYPDSFNHDFEQKGADRNILGVVGEGAYEDLMILSQHELRQGFLNKSGKTNTAIHEFVHLIDKTDGSTDGIPESILERQYVLPWLNLVQRQMKQILANRSDIDPYGATNQAEFLAVVAEYFFERPDLLQNKHPQLYELLAKIFQQRPGAGSSKD